MNESGVLTTEQFDLNNCDREPIHISGAIQPHGLLFVLQEPDLTILQVSKNTFNLLGRHPEKLLNENLNTLLDEYNIDLLKSCLSQEDIRNKNPIKFTIKIEEHRNVLFDGIIHRHDGLLILELEPSRFADNISFLNFYDLVRSSVSKLQNASNLDELCQSMVKEVRKINGFDRVMIYRFNQDGDGTILAEDKLEKLDPFLGLHYPATDVPKQARTLYCLNWLRLIADINYQPSEIIPFNNPITNQPTDLSNSVLRSVSRLHIEYLQNMGVRASMSISLIKNKQLWGLIACHHYSPKYVSYEVRKACEFLGQVMSLELASKEDNEDYEYKLELSKVQEKILEYVSQEENFIDGLIKYQPNILNLVDASGAAVFFDGNYTLVGETPQLEDLNHLVELLENNFTEEIFYTESLARLDPAGEKFKDVASGVLAISLSQSQKNYILWFRPEVIQTVNWAGEPKKPVEMTEDGSVRLSPRKSFELWKETVRLKSLPWKKCEIDAALGLRSAVINIVLKKAEEIAKLNTALQESEAYSRNQAEQLEIALQELQRTQTQLIQNEKMSSLGQLVAGVAHEINNPINFIYGNLNHARENTQDLLNLVALYQQYYPSPTPEIQDGIEDIDLEFMNEDLPKLLSSMQVGADRIREIVQSLRNFSRLDEAAIKAVDIHEGIDSTLLILRHRLKSNDEIRNVEIIKDYGKLPLVECYAGQLNQVFMNIIANAIDALEAGVSKTSGDDQQKQHPTPTIKISTEVSERTSDDNTSTSWVIIRIADNGAGIPEELQLRIFDPFFTTKPVGKGTGIGLALSYQIVVEKHGGMLSCTSAPHQGTEFVIEIPVSQK
ncbi:MAG TPA: ATP-binding protein [Oculatellaceae cyanobacterium]|jgi:light-regulated signal transduction histidine kinase (bacteriophytochrome)